MCADPLEGQNQRKRLHEFRCGGYTGEYPVWKKLCFALLIGPIEESVSITISQGNTSLPWAVEIKRLYKTAEGT